MLRGKSAPQFVGNGGDMKARTILLSLTLCFVSVAVCFAQDAFMGTWKLNEAKSKLSSGAPKNSTVVYEAAGENVKVTIDGTDRDGKPTHNQWTGKFDGKDYITSVSIADNRCRSRGNQEFSRCGRLFLFTNGQQGMF
jgi:hypothetical protein